MSIRSTFEFNHDCAHKIERDPEQFVADLLNYLRCGFENEAEHMKLYYGMERVWWGHHSTERPYPPPQKEAR